MTAAKTTSCVKIANAGNTANNWGLFQLSILHCQWYPINFSLLKLIGYKTFLHIKWCFIFVMVISIMKYYAKVIHVSDWLLKKWHHQVNPKNKKLLPGPMEMPKLLQTHKTNKIMVDRPSNVRCLKLLASFSIPFPADRSEQMSIWR